MAADTGMRRSELQRLTWRDVDFDTGTMTVRQSKNKDYRVIPMTDRVRSLLMRLKPELTEPEQPVIVFGDIKRSLHSAGMRANLGHVHMHMLRRTTATRLRDRGVPLDRIMELMGHRSYSVALRYAKARPQQLVEAIAALNTSPGVIGRCWRLLSGCHGESVDPAHPIDLSVSGPRCKTPMLGEHRMFGRFSGLIPNRVLAVSESLTMVA